jgi:UDP:flavonoid glycosyltransferase YjiC (YdhE family)
MLGWGGLQKTDLPESIYPITAAPFDWLFPKMALVVHHGGAGTTGTGLRAGVPSLIVPFFGDQPFWGWRVRELGVGPKPIPHKKLSADSLAFAIHQTLADKEMAAKAAALGKQIQSENGVAKAVSVLRQFLGKGSSPV